MERFLTSLHHLFISIIQVLTYGFVGNNEQIAVEFCNTMCYFIHTLLKKLCGGVKMPKYNHSFEESDGVMYEHWTNRAGTEHTWKELPDYDDSEGGDEGCAACGNPAYPECKTSCPLFDDDY